jgi:hypothetical protein
MQVYFVAMHDGVVGHWISTLAVLAESTYSALFPVRTKQNFVVSGQKVIININSFHPQLIENE